jgi:hypothetical protein
MGAGTDLIQIRSGNPDEILKSSKEDTRGANLETVVQIGTARLPPQDLILEKLVADVSAKDPNHHHRAPRTGR